MLVQVSENISPLALRMIVSAYYGKTNVRECEKIL